MQYLLATNFLDIVAGDFNFDLLKESENNLLLNHSMEHVQIVNKPIHISGSLIVTPTFAIKLGTSICRFWADLFHFLF